MIVARVRVAVAFVAVIGCAGVDRPAEPTSPAVATVELSQYAVTMQVGAVIAIQAVARDASGASLTGRPITWTVADTSVAQVTANGYVVARALGTTSITAASEGRSATLAVVVRPPFVARVLVTPARSYLRIGEHVTFQAGLQDAGGASLTGRVVVWSSSDTTRVSISVDGVGTALGEGTVRITAVADTAHGQADVSVVVLPTPTITAIAPDTLFPGATATISGADFSATATDDTVSIAGARATVIAASATELVVRIPATLPCLPTGPASVTVLTGGGPTSRDHPARVARQRTLAIGEHLVIGDRAELGCNELTPGGRRYLLSLLNTSIVSSSRAAVDLRGRDASAGLPPASSPSAAARVPLTTRRTGGWLADPRTTATLARARERSEEHLARLDRDRALIREFSSRRSQYLAAGRRLARAVPADLTSRQRAMAPSASSVTGLATAAVGDTLRLRVPTTGCNFFKSVSARVVYSGAHAIALEDLAGALAGQVDDSYQRLGALFDETLFPILTTFGDIAAFDAQLLNPGKVLMLFTPAVNAAGDGLLGFVAGCDFFPAAAPGYAASNQTRIFYARAPLHRTALSVGSLDFDALPQWELLMPATLVHEAKHIVSYAERIARGAATGEVSWLEEGTAQIASELYGRTIWRDAHWKGNATYRNTAFCEWRNLFAIPAPECAGMNFTLADAFASLDVYYGEIESRSFLSPGYVDGTIYGSAWQFVRWMVDEHGGADEAALLRALVQENALTGVANVQAKTGLDFARLLGEYTLAMAADDVPGLAVSPASPAQLRSWNTRDMFAGLATDLVGMQAQPLALHARTMGSFAVSIPSIAGGSAAFVDLRGAGTERQLLDLSRLPSSTAVRLAIIRVE